jgi:hypothetical protein
VSAAGVANEFKVPLISPASSSPQITGMEFVYRTVPSDRCAAHCGAAVCAGPCSRVRVRSRHQRSTATGSASNQTLAGAWL